MSNENCVFSLKTQKEEQLLMNVKREEGKERGGGGGEKRENPKKTRDGKQCNAKNKVKRDK